MFFMVGITKNELHGVQQDAVRIGPVTSDVFRLSLTAPPAHITAAPLCSLPSNAWKGVPIPHLHSFPQVVVNGISDTSSRNSIAARRNPLPGVQSVPRTPSIAIQVHCDVIPWQMFSYCPFHCSVNPTLSRNRTAALPLMRPNLLPAGRST
ncbi:hypothetical protein M514_09509 [Trichuris suis]|uniref:Uncharacterized protein n=1 Tax=Trichuris suis TaxID=68888 RepID=A0A085NA40_9BILA|nr:hypothetical protein M513_09509 [Trichuris suis]KFD66336.1 hypothetical protein M514_09509 [Trichuris suis]